MAQRVHGAQAFLKGSGAHGRCHLHVAAGFQVVAVGAGRRQPFLDQAHAFQRDAIGHGMKQRAAVGLHVVGQRVHSHRRGQVRRQARGQLRVLDDDARQHLRVKNDAFGMVLEIGDDTGSTHLGASPRSRRHSDHRRDAFRIGPCVPVLAILRNPRVVAFARP